MSKFEDQVCKKMQDRAEFGLKKYNVGVDRTDLSMQQWLVHLQEELMDASIYAERLLAFNEPTVDQFIALLELMNNKLNEDTFFNQLTVENLETIRTVTSNILTILPEVSNEDDLHEQSLPISDEL